MKIKEFLKVNFMIDIDRQKCRNCGSLNLDYTLHDDIKVLYESGYDGAIKQLCAMSDILTIICEDCQESIKIDSYNKHLFTVLCIK